MHAASYFGVPVLEFSPVAIQLAMVLKGSLAAGVVRVVTNPPLPQLPKLDQVQSGFSVAYLRLDMLWMV